MDKTIHYIIKSARPRQIIKNISLFVAIVFNGWLFLPDKFLTVLAGSALFTMLSSAIYIFNDVVDLKKDRLHPFKRKRPIAAGLLNPKVALITSLSLILACFTFSWLLSKYFLVLCLAYLLLQIAYSLALKNFPIIDVLSIASGFIIRVYAGAAVINAHINAWLLLCIVSFSLFLAIGKRRSELTLLSKKKAGKHRETLSFYPEKLLDSYVSMFANTTWLTYAFFTFMYPSKSINSGKIIDIITLLPKTFTIQKLLMLTVPIVIFGVMRYLWIIYQKKEGESPEKVLLTDKQMLITVSVWILLVISIIYGVS
jgi:4-hydroxybenzoate polyprenyltransferase